MRLKQNSKIVLYALIIAFALFISGCTLPQNIGGDASATPYTGGYDIKATYTSDKIILELSVKEGIFALYKKVGINGRFSGNLAVNDYTKQTKDYTIITVGTGARAEIKRSLIKDGDLISFAAYKLEGNSWDTTKYYTFSYIVKSPDGLTSTTATSTTTTTTLSPVTSTIATTTTTAKPISTTTSSTTTSTTTTTLKPVSDCPSGATCYYVSSSLGNDANSGLSPSNPWKSLEKVSTTTFKPGNFILFKRGDVWREQLVVLSSGAPGSPIVFGAYGVGEKPIIDGADEITGFSNVGSNIWQKTGITTRPYIMFLDDEAYEAVDYLVSVDSYGDWYLDNTNYAVYVYSETNPDGKVQLGQRMVLINAQSRHYITLEDLTIQHSNTHVIPGVSTRGAVWMMFGSYLTVSGCTIKDNRMTGLHIVDSPHIIVDNNIFLRNGQTNNEGHNFAFTTFKPGIANITFSNNICSYAGWNGAVIYTADIANRINNVNVHGNTFTHNKGAGLYTIKCNHVSVYNNTFDSNGDATTSKEDYAYGIEGCNHVDFFDNMITNQLNNDAIQMYSDDIESGHNVRIFRNFIDGVANGDGIGIHTQDDRTSEDVEIFSNVIIDADHYGIRPGRGTEDAGISSKVYIYNNTLYGNTWGDVATSSALVPMDLKNNIFASDAVNVRAKDRLTTANNLWYRPSGNVLSYGSSTYTTATIKNFEPSAHTANPLFTDAPNGDFSLRWDSPAIDSGAGEDSIGGVSTDFFGNPIYGVPDIGAIEYQPPFDILFDEIDFSLSKQIRIYGDGKYRHIVSISGIGSGVLRVVPVGGFSSFSSDEARPAFFDLTISNFDSKNVLFSVKNLSSVGNVNFSVCDLSVLGSYVLFVDGSFYDNYVANGSGCVNFQYSGPWSVHTFEFLLQQ